MNPTRKRRLYLVLALALGSALVIGLVLLGLGKNVNMFYLPGQITSGEAPHDRNIRAGGMVLEGSWQRRQLLSTFVLTDRQAAQFTVQYEGILPDLFREGQGVIVEGRLGDDGVFVAREVLAKHDENYMPPELAGMERPQ
ncbi:MAG: cytochrome c maturation protein CcmE [Pseudomonadales bacterium]|nr:cytochrome c maturation protein CcmE [Pseudomonadales bacterium]MCP5183156.1 cytochrome c maturation protein CcmE [Pseudomonadales bacterium]